VPGDHTGGGWGRAVALVGGIILVLLGRCTRLGSGSAVGAPDGPR
jgi:hypothetical protein